MKITGALVAKVLRRAADEHLVARDADSWGDEGGHTDSHTCCAINIALDKTFSGLAHDVISPGIIDSQISRAIHQYLNALGCETGSLSAFSEFRELDPVPKGQAHCRQGARFLWLHFAALVAEEQFEDIIKD